MANFIYDCRCFCGCEQGYDYQPAQICSECQDCCEHKNTRWLHLETKECLEAECASADADVCNLAICIDCGASVDY